MKLGHVLPLAAGVLLGACQLAFADVEFTVNDTPGHWFDVGSAWDLPGIDNKPLGGRSLVVIKPGETVLFKQRGGEKVNGKSRDVESFHTVTNLVWPSAAGDKPVLDQETANWNNHTVITYPGLYVFVCKLHPYMLGAVVVDDRNPMSKTRLKYRMKLLSGNRSFIGISTTGGIWYLISFQVTAFHPGYLLMNVPDVCGFLYRDF